MDKGESSTPGIKLERKTIEKNRRILMKNLCSELVSLIPDHHFKQEKAFLSQQDQIEQSTNYIKIQRERIEELRRRKTQLVPMNPQDGTTNAVDMGGSELLELEIREMGSSLDVVLVSGIRKKIMLSQVISTIEQEGAEVVAVNLSNADDKIFHALHAKVKFSRVGVDIERIRERIQELI